jgi:cytochrome c oxidase subunit 3
MTTSATIAAPGPPILDDPAAAPTSTDASDRSHPIAWWGMVMLVLTEAMVFLALLSAYFYVWAINPTWPQGGIAPPELARIAGFSVLLLGSSIPMVLAEHAGRRDLQPRLRATLAVAFVMAAVFLGNQVLEYRDLGFSADDNAYASLFIVITGLHGLHVLGALVMSAMVQAKAWTGRIRPGRLLTLRVLGIYWHFVDGVWVAVFSSLYLAVHLAGR